MLNKRLALCAVLVCLSMSGAQAQQVMTKPAAAVTSYISNLEPSAAKAGSYFSATVIPTCLSVFINCLFHFPKFPENVIVSDISCEFVSHNAPRSASFETTTYKDGDRYHLPVNDSVYTVNPYNTDENVYTTTINQKVFLRVKKGAEPRLNFYTAGVAAPRWGDARCSLQGVVN